MTTPHRSPLRYPSPVPGVGALSGRDVSPCREGDTSLRESIVRSNTAGMYSQHHHRHSVLVTDEGEDPSVTVSKIAAYVQEMEDKKRVQQKKSRTQLLSEAGRTENLSLELGTLRRQLVTARESIRTQASSEEALRDEVHSLKLQLAKEKEAAEIVLLQMRPLEQKIGTLEQTCKQSVSKADHDKLKTEYNNILHSSLSLQREAAQLKAELLEQQSKEGREERHRLREETWKIEQVHQEEVIRLRKRLEIVKEEAANEAVQLRRALEADKRELRARLEDCVPIDDYNLLRARLTEKQLEIEELAKDKANLEHASASLVPASSLEAAEQQQLQRAQQVEELVAALKTEKSLRATDQQHVQALSAQVTEHQQTATRLRTDAAQLENDASELRQKLHSATHLHESLLDKHELLERHSKENEKLLDKSQRDHEALLLSERHLNEQLEALKRDKTECEANVVLLTASMQELRSELHMEQTKNHALESKISSLEGDLDTQTSKAIAQQKSYEATFEDMQRENTALNTTLGETQREFRQREVRLVDVESSFQEVQTVNEHLEEQCQKTLQTAAALKTQLTDAKKQLAAREDRVASLSENLAACQAALKASESKLRLYQSHFTEFVKPSFAAAKKAGILSGG
ncbi:hypothetical protein DIPPA_05312 [Diplonema papillatum]|nr:hypothetical protein DIPPA_05312 [Diplonema papillatum]